MDAKRYTKLTTFGKKLMSLDDMQSVIELIAQEAKELVDAQRCSLFIVDKEENILWTKLSDGIGRIVIATDSGIVGDTYKTREPQLVNNPYEDERFLSSIDKKSGFTTKNMITVPIFNSKQEVMGVMQLLNKNRFEFDEKDVELLTFFANYVSGALELALLQEK